jgi:hypothetical protein
MGIRDGIRRRVLIRSASGDFFQFLLIKKDSFKMLKNHSRRIQGGEGVSHDDVVSCTSR